MNKYVRVMDGLKSNAGNFEYKIDEVNITEKWNPNSETPEEFGGFNFSTEDKILRWLHRGDTMYDVIIPSDAEVILCDEEKGIYRANKIIITNPRPITDELVIELYHKTSLSNKIIAQCLVTLLWKKRQKISEYIIRDKVNLENIDEILEEFINYAKEDNLNSETGKEIYDILKEIQSNLLISISVSKEPYEKRITTDNIINITGESGSGKSTYTKKYLNDNNYIVIDTDEIMSNRPTTNKNCLEFRSYLFNKYKDNMPDICKDFNIVYKEILDYYKDCGKTLIIDSAQYRNLKTENDLKLLKGKIIVIRTSIDECYKRVIERWKSININYTEEDLSKYKTRKLGMYKWYKSLNEFLVKIEML